MKRILSVMLSVFLIASMLTVGVSAATRVFADDEWNGQTFTAEVHDSMGRRAVSPSFGLTADEYAKYYNEGYDQTVGDKDKSGNSKPYTVYGKDTSFTVNTGVTWRVGGCWSSPAGKNIAFCKAPLDFDIDLNGEKEISGIRIYDTGEVAGALRECEVYVKCNADETDWHFVKKYSTGSDDTSTIDFGYNVIVSNVRVRVTKSATTSAAITSSDGKYSIPAGVMAYFAFAGFTLLKPNEAYSMPEQDDEIIINPAEITGYYKDDANDSLTPSMKKLMDGNTLTSVILNGGSCVDFGKTVEFSGIRYYPPVNGTAYNVVRSFGEGGGVNIYDDLSVAEDGKVTYVNKKRVTLPSDPLVYPEKDGVTDYTGAVTVDFGKNVTSRGLWFSLYYVPGQETAASAYAGEIRLLAPKDYSHGYVLKDDVLKLSKTPEVIDKGASRTEAGVKFSNPGSLFDEIIYLSTDEHDKNDYDSFVSFEYANFKDGETAWLTIDLGDETEFSALRLFGRIGYDMNPTKTKLYFSNDNVTWSRASYNEDSVTGLYSDTDMRAYRKSGDIYTDLKPNDGKTDYSVSARYVKIEMLGSSGENRHAAISEIMFIKPGDDVKTIDELNNAIAKNSVELSIKEAQSGVLKAEGDANDGKGIIRFITEFLKVDSKVGTKVTSFGTYAIRNDKGASFSETTDISGMSANTAVYTVGEGEGEVKAPSAGDTYSVDITGIDEKYFTVPVYAISFAKIEGYDNLILTGVKTVEVDKNTNLSYAETAAEDGE